MTLPLLENASNRTWIIWRFPWAKEYYLFQKDGEKKERLPGLRSTHWWLCLCSWWFMVALPRGRKRKGKHWVFQLETSLFRSLAVTKAFSWWGAVLGGGGATEIVGWNGSIEGGYCCCCCCCYYYYYYLFFFSSSFPLFSFCFLSYFLYKFHLYL